MANRTIAVLASIVALASTGAQTGPAARAGSPVATVTVEPTHPGVAIPAGFIGFSHEWGQAQLLMGDPAIGVNGVYRQLLRNLIAQGGGPVVLRIGGGTTDRMDEPRSNTLRPLARLFTDLAVPSPAISFILGVNLGRKDGGLAVRQARQYVDGLPPGSIQAIEIGNQPDTYERQGYRPKGWGFADYLDELHEWTDRIQAAVPSAPVFMGPSVADIPPMTTFGQPHDFRKLLMRERATIGVISQSAYADGAACGATPQPGYFLKASSATAVPKRAAPFVDIATQAGKPYRVAELSAVACAGAPGVGDTFETALWTPDVLFEFAKLGIAGVDVRSNLWSAARRWDVTGAFLFDVPERQHAAAHTETEPPPDERFTPDYRLRAVLPLYYGLLFFAEATAHHAALVSMTLSTTANVKAWATVDGTNTVRVALINKDTAATGPIEVSVPGFETATVKRLLAPSYRATKGITWGGQTFDGSIDGRLVGSPKVETVESTPDCVFTITLAPTSAALLILKR